MDRRLDTVRMEYQYLVKWKNYTHADNTWEPESQLLEDVPELVFDYIDFNEKIDEDLPIAKVVEH